MLDTNSPRVEVDTRRMLVEKYFRETPDPGKQRRAITQMSVSAVGGLLAIILLTAENGIFFGLLFLVASGFGGYRGFRILAKYKKQYAAAEPKPSDEEMDKLLAKDLDFVSKRAMRRLGLTPDELELPEEQWDPVAHLTRGNPLIDQLQKRPMLVFGPDFFTSKTIGRDGIWRFAAYQVMAICPTGYHLGLYRTNIDFLTGTLQHEETQEYHYSDVVAVSTTTTADQESVKSLDLRARGGKMIYFAKSVHRNFQIVVSSGDRSKILVGIHDQENPEVQANLQPSGIDDVIRSVRRMLKEKKGGAVGSPEQI